MCGNNHCSDDKCGISYDVKLSATNVKKFSDAYTLQDDWELESRYFYNITDDAYQIIENHPNFLSDKNLCGVFDFSAELKIKNNSDQNINNPSLILPYLFSVINEKDESDIKYKFYENQNFLILIQQKTNDEIKNPKVIGYEQNTNGEISYINSLFNIDNEGIMVFNDSIYSRMIQVIKFDIHIYVKNFYDKFSFNTILYGSVGSKNKCSCDCYLKQSNLPIIDNSSISLIYDCSC